MAQSEKRDGEIIWQLAFSISRVILISSMFVAHVGILFHLLMLPFIAPMLAVLGRVSPIMKF